MRVTAHIIMMFFHLEMETSWLLRDQFEGEMREITYIVHVIYDIVYQDTLAIKIQYTQSICILIRYSVY